MAVTTNAVVIPPAPSKYDVVPIHASDRASFKKCRRRWNWTSPMRNNLSPKASEHGVYLPLWFGSGIHWALRLYYDPSLQRDPVETFKTWWDIQWNGGVISEDWLDTTYDRNPVQQGIAWKVRGLQDILAMPEVQAEEFEQHLELGIGMLSFYKEYAAAHDNFDVLVAERTFSVPIFDNEGVPLTWTDPRDGEEKEVHLRGTQDAIIQDRPTEKYGILEHKTAAKIDEDYFTKLDKDEQVTNYMWAAEVEARVHDLPFKKVEFVLYNALRKAFPKPPTITSRGDISIDRQKESTTYPMLMRTLDQLGLTEEGPDGVPYWHHNVKLANYVNYVKEAGEEQFIVRTPVLRNLYERKSCGTRVFAEALDMLDSPRIYPNPTGDWYCLRCPFRAPCIAADDGSDWKMMLEDGYEKNWTR